MGQIAFYIGIVLTVIGLIGLGLCIRKAIAIKRSGEDEGSRAALNMLVAMNMASVGTAFFGLALVVVGLLF